MARLQPGGNRPFLCATSARSGHGEGLAAKTHRAGYRLAHPRGAQEGDEVMISRREFVRDIAVAGAASALGIWSEAVEAESPPETTRLRIAEQPSICVAPQFIVTELLKAEGFTDIKYVKVTIAGIAKALASGEVDISMH